MSSEADKAGADAGINESGSPKDQLNELSLLANDAGGDFDPGKAGVGQDAAGSQRGGGESGAILGVLVMSVCSIVAARRGDHWNLKPDEAEQIGMAAGAVLDKYMPNVEAGPEFTLVMVCLTVFGPRAMMEAQLQQSGEGESGKDGDKPESKPAK